MCRLCSSTASASRAATRRPSIDLAQCDLAAGQQCPRSMQAISAQGSRHCVLTPLEFFVQTLDGIRAEWRNSILPAYRRLTRKAKALIAGVLSGNMRWVRRALAALFGGAVGKDTVSAARRKQVDPLWPLRLRTGEGGPTRSILQKAKGLDIQFTSTAHLAKPS